MNRRYFLAFPGLGALLAPKLFGQARQVMAPGDGTIPRPSRKVLSKHTGAKSSYKVPKSAAKQAKYVASMAALLALTSSQQQQAAAIFSNASAGQKGAHKSLKAARKALSNAVKNNDTAGIAQASATISTLTSQHIASGALANAAFYQLLTPDQQSRLAQFQG